MPKQSKTQKLRQSISIIGPGKVGQALAHALQSLGYPIVALVFRNQEKVQKFSEYGRSSFPETKLLAFDDLGKLPKSDLIFITTSDDAIAETVQQLAALGRALVNLQKRPLSRFPGAILHTSGALSSEILAPLAIPSACQVGSIHPLVSVTAGTPDASVFAGAYFCVEGEKMAVIYAEWIIRELGAQSIHIRTDRKALYHAAALMASPHLVALFDLAIELLTCCGLDWRGMARDEARKILLPLVESTVKNLHASDPSLALTGTFARGDAGTVARHLQALSAENSELPPDALEVYKLLGMRSLQLAKKRGLDPKKISEITKLLTEASPKLSRETKDTSPRVKPASRRKRTEP
jgi:predicted short-subunit dehydrogenase-like oxidoreductase (DUF2520 family)